MRWPFRARRRDHASRTLVLVDGRNVQRSTWPNPTDDLLVEALARWAEEEPGRDVVVVFDGRVEASASPVDVVCVAYADNELVERARAARVAGRTVLAATSDRELRERLEAIGVEVPWGGGRLLGELGLSQRGRRR
jgi:hypothetical protein